ncbi:MAG: hypothetical protein ABUS79_30845, partial [Pseudomonadota bacterium]
HPAFIAGEYDTGFIERYKAELAPVVADDRTAQLAAVAAALEAARAGLGAPLALDVSHTQPSAWRRGTRD